MRTRFAPSPTGLLHVGNARIALMNWLFAKKHGGEFLLRIEDTDRERSKREYEEAILEDLKWFLGWEGVFLRQSERVEIYKRHAEELLLEGKAYLCFCTPEELERRRKERLARGLPPLYDGKCRSLTKEQIKKLQAEGRKPSLRFKVGLEEVSFEDGIFGRLSFKGERLGDFVIMRSDGWPTYNFACVIDDHYMGVTHVIRGEDHLSNTPRQILLYRAFGWDPPEFSHVPLLLGPDGKVLSKRHGPTSLKEFREMGILPKALANYLLSLGGTIGEEVILSWEEMADRFSLSGLSRGKPVFDMGRLLWFNRQHLQKDSVEELVKYLRGPLEGWQKEAVSYLKEEVSTLLELQRFLDYLSRELPMCSDSLKAPKTRELLRLALNELEKDQAGWLERLVELSGLKPKEVLPLMRIVLLGTPSGPPLNKVLSFLPKEIIRKKIEKALETMEGCPHGSLPV